MSKGIGGSAGKGPDNSGKGIPGSARNTTSSNTSGTNQTAGDCFIATAAFGTPWASEIQVLRNFRDNTLRHSSSGRKFISIYYAKGPKVVKLLNLVPMFKSCVRQAIRMMIRMIESKS